MSEFDESVEDETEATGKFQPGTLYFMQETDHLNGEKFEYYKIGIVRGEKEVTKRELEHRTGNPRAITSIRDIQTPGVQIVETSLHNAFAKHRVSSGEWFYLPGALLQDAIHLAEKLAAEIGGEIDALAASASASKGDHSGAVIATDAKLADLVQAWVNAEAKQKSLTSIENSIAKKLKEVAGNNPDFSYLFKTSESKAKREFNAALMQKFSKEMKDLYASYMVEGATSWKFNALVSADPNAVVEAIEIDGLGEIELHHLYLEYWAKSSEAELERDLAKAKVNSAVGSAAGIEGLVEWTSSTGNKFDKTRFKQEHPELYEQFHKETEASTTIKAAEWASYKK